MDTGAQPHRGRHKRHCRKPLHERFWAKVRSGNGCWLWIGSLDTHGYGQIHRGGRGNGNLLAHRLSWEMHKGVIPSGLLVLHRCDNPRCVNPAHLFLGTNQDNTNDKLAKGRQPSKFGERNPKAKLTEGDVAYIRESDIDRLSLARYFGVTRTHIGYIQRGKAWTRAA